MSEYRHSPAAEGEVRRGYSLSVVILVAAACLVLGMGIAAFAGLRLDFRTDGGSNQTEEVAVTSAHLATAEADADVLRQAMMRKMSVLKTEIEASHAVNDAIFESMKDTVMRKRTRRMDAGGEMVTGEGFENNEIYAGGRPADTEIVLPF